MENKEAPEEEAPPSKPQSAAQLAEVAMREKLKANKVQWIIKQLGLSSTPPRALEQHPRLLKLS